VWGNLVNPRITLLFFLFLLPALSFPSRPCLGQEARVPQGGCVALNKNKPPLFLSYERQDDKAWDGRNYVTGILLRLNNNSNCDISLTAPPGYVREVPPTLGIKDGKLVRLSDVRIGSIKSGAKVELYYLTEYPGDKSLYVDGDFHVIDTIFLNNGDYIFFSVPLKNFKRGGQVLVPFNYDWDTDSFLEGSRMKVLFRTTQHYLIFDPEQLPPEILK